MEVAELVHWTLQITTVSLLTKGWGDGLVPLRGWKDPNYQCKHLAWTLFQQFCAPSHPITSAPALGEQKSLHTKGKKRQPAVQQYLIHSWHQILQESQPHFNTNQNYYIWPFWFFFFKAWFVAKGPCPKQECWQSSCLCTANHKQDALWTGKKETSLISCYYLFLYI